MGFIEILLIGIGLSMDAFAASICKGLNMQKVNKADAVVIGLFFGSFQAVMPLIGWILGRQFESYIISFDHWAAFGLLAFLGGKMIVEALKCGDDETAETLDIKELLLMAIATSIDALAVGITFAFLKVNIIGSVSIIGISTFILSFIGVHIGNRFGSKFKTKAELAGGIILILIGVKILFEHLGIM